VSIEFKLTEDEALLLDGRVGQPSQALIDAIKNLRKNRERMSDLPQLDADFITKSCGIAKHSGRLDLRWDNYYECALCDKKKSYYLHKRDSRSRYGHKKGEPNYDSPRTHYGVDLASGFISFKGRAAHGCCQECWARIKPRLALELADVCAEITPAITDHPPKFKRYDKAKCTKCGWEGHQGQMGKLMAIMGGYYPGECPSCKAQNLPFSRNLIDVGDGFVVVAVETKEATR
jgi:hypothetical protein